MISRKLRAPVMGAGVSGGTAGCAPGAAGRRWLCAAPEARLGPDQRLLVPGRGTRAQGACPPVVDLPVVGKPRLDLTQVGEGVVGGQALAPLLLPAGTWSSGGSGLAGVRGAGRGRRGARRRSRSGWGLGRTRHCPRAPQGPAPPVGRLPASPPGLLGGRQGVIAEEAQLPCPVNCRGLRGALLTPWPAWPGAGLGAHRPHGRASSWGVSQTVVPPAATTRTAALQTALWVQGLGEVGVGQWRGASRRPLTCAPTALLACCLLRQSWPRTRAL